MGKKQEKITADELAAICNQEFDLAVGLTTEIQGDRKEALDRYNQEPFGNEEDGLSKFVASDVRDVIEWQMPQICDIFVSGDTPVVFEPQNADDVKDAEVESQFCQYVFQRQNNGVIIFQTWVKDAFLQKNGIVKVFRNKRVAMEREEYEGKSSLEYQELMADEEFTVREITVEVGDKEYSEDEYLALLQSLPSQVATIEAAAKFHILGYRKSTVKETVIENVPPENFVISRSHNSIFPKDAGYACDYYEKTRSQLMEMGYDYETVYALPASTGIAENMQTAEKQTRMVQEGGVTVGQNTSSGGDRSRELVMVYDHYIRADFNGDGFAETRLVRMAGKTSDAKYMLENEEVDRNPYHAVTPYINSYRFYGRSVADNLKDIVRIKTQLWRNGLDNVAYSAIPRNLVKGNVDINALNTYIQGGIIKAGADGEVTPLVTPFVADTAIMLADKADALRAERTGFSKETMGLAPDALANSNNPVAMAILSQSQLLTKMIATIFANSGFMTLMEHIRELTIKYEDAEKVFDLTGSFMTTDPRRWRKKRSSMAKVGLGFAGRMEELATVDKVMSLQETFVTAQGGIQGPLVNPQGIYNAATRLCKRMGVKDASQFFQDPATYTPPPPQPTLAEKTLQAQVENMQAQNTISDAKVGQDARKLELDQDYRKAELEQKERLAEKELESKERMFEMELRYKYGKDAADRHEESMNRAVEAATEKTTTPKEEKKDNDDNAGK